jgi:hypothetical protein
MPGLSMDESLSHILRRIAGIGVAYCYADILNPRPKVWLSLRPLLEENFPDQVAPTRIMLYNQKERMNYQRVTRDRIQRLARRSGLKGEIRFCF